MTGVGFGYDAIGNYHKMIKHYLILSVCLSVCHGSNQHTQGGRRKQTEGSFANGLTLTTKQRLLFVLTRKYRRPARRDLRWGPRRWRCHPRP